MSDSERHEDDEELTGQVAEGDETTALDSEQTGEEASPDLTDTGEASADAPEGDEAAEDLTDDGGTPVRAPGLPGDFKENWTLLACCTSLFIATMWLPIEGGVLDLYAKDSIAGGFLAVFAGYGVIGCIFNILHRKMIVLPAVMAGFDGLYVAIRRLAQLIDQMPADAAGRDYMRMGGSGLWIILGCSLWVFVTLFKSAAAGKARENDRREASRAAKADKRRETRQI